MAPTNLTFVPLHGSESPSDVARFPQNSQYDVSLRGRADGDLRTALPDEELPWLTFLKRREIDDGDDQIHRLTTTSELSKRRRIVLLMTARP
jgi:hypothetical protein